MSSTKEKISEMSEGESYSVLVEERYSIGTTYIAREICQGEDNGLADAKLIAAAPTMLEALMEAYKELEFHNWHNTKTGFQILQAIKQATE